MNNDIENYKLPDEIEQYALSLYPITMTNVEVAEKGSWLKIDVNQPIREAFIKGYHLACVDWTKGVAQAANEYFKKGYKAALEKCPKWKVADRDLDCDTIEFAVMYRNDGGDYPDYDTVTVTNRLHKGEMYLELCDLDALLLKE